MTAKRTGVGVEVGVGAGVSLGGTAVSVGECVSVCVCAGSGVAVGVSLDGWKGVPVGNSKTKVGVVCGEDVQPASSVRTNRKLKISHLDGLLLECWLYNFILSFVMDKDTFQKLIPARKAILDKNHPAGVQRRFQNC